MNMQAQVVKLEEEAAGIALATEEEFTQYQQLKQVSIVSLSFASGTTAVLHLPVALLQSVHACNAPTIQQHAVVLCTQYCAAVPFIDLTLASI